VGSVSVGRVLDAALPNVKEGAPSKQMVDDESFSVDLALYDLVEDRKAMLKAMLPFRVGTSGGDLKLKEKYYGPAHTQWRKRKAPDGYECYVKGQPIEGLVRAPVQFFVPTGVRFERTHIVAGSGHGKTYYCKRSLPTT
jgi:hypothetical protein